jgi:signal transduction histidine kinase
VVLACSGEETELSVSDHGAGIPEEDRERIFEPFRRVGLSKERVPGIGLGLFVVRKIVEAHHGRIEVNSVPGEGSTFRIFLPTARVVQQREAPPRVCSGSART